MFTALRESGRRVMLDLHHMDDRPDVGAGAAVSERRSSASGSRWTLPGRNLLGDHSRVY